MDSWEIADKLTPIPQREFILAVAEVWTKFYGHAPQSEQLACCLAQMVLETGRVPDPSNHGSYLWGKAAHNYNWGNIKHKGAGDPHHWQFYPAGEYIKGVHMMFYPPHEQCRFRAYLSARDGMHDYLRFLAVDRDRYLKAWNYGVLKGEPVVFSCELGKAGYYTAPIDRYTKTVVSLFGEFLVDVDCVMESPDGQLVFADERRAFAQQLANMASLTAWQSFRGEFGDSVESLAESDATASITPNVPA